MHVAVSNSLRKMFQTMRPIVIPSAGAPPHRRKLGSDVVRSTLGLPLVLGRLGTLELRLATTRREIRQAQRLRYDVFFEEGPATAPAHLRLLRRDKDAFDRVCDHLLVIDHAPDPGPQKVNVLRHRGGRVVGTYRLLRQEVAMANFGFYTSGEFDVATLMARHPDQRFLELGRSCVLAPYRNKKTVELLWQGIWAYVLHHRIDVMFGCASLMGTQPSKLKQELAFLHHFARPLPDWNAGAVPGRFTPMNVLAREDIDERRALTALPPLIKGYLRLGAKIGAGAVIDHQFGTTDVLIVLRVADIDPRYISYYGPEANRYAA
jgi:putative hemolysin